LLLIISFTAFPADYFAVPSLAFLMSDLFPFRRMPTSAFVPLAYLLGSTSFPAEAVAKTDLLITNFGLDLQGAYFVATAFKVRINGTA
jgi:hypothetical protein